MIPWTLEEALDYIRSAQPLAMSSGYYLALAGEVLNPGSSANDLDIVAIPRNRKDADRSLLLSRLTTVFGRMSNPPWPLANGVVWSFVVHDRIIEVSVISHE